jgi:phosphoribosylformylglycinamidine synthase
VQGNTVLTPLVGPGGRGPGDAAVIEPVPGSNRAVAIACGLQTGIGDPARGGDPYLMALAAIDECVRNLVSVGADPHRTAILDNFCWPSCDKPENLGALVRAAEGCYDGAKAYRTPFVSGKDSLNNQFRFEQDGKTITIEIPPTLLISGIAIVPAASRCTTMEAKKAGNTLMLIGATTPHMGGSHYQRLFGLPDSSQRSDESHRVPVTDLSAGPRTARAVAELIRQGLIVSCHDCSDGGLLVALAEMLIGSGSAGPALAAPAADSLSRLLAPSPAHLPTTPSALGLDLTLDEGMLHQFEAAFAETPSRYIVEVRREDLKRLRTILTDHGGIFAAPLGTLATHGRLIWERADLDLPVEDLASAWLKPLDW